MVRKQCVRGSIFPLPKGHVWRLTFVSCCRRRPIGRRAFDLSMSDGIPSFRGGNPPTPPSSSRRAHKGRFFRHDTYPGALRLLPLGEGTQNLPQKAQEGGYGREGTGGSERSCVCQTRWVSD